MKILVRSACVVMLLGPIAASRTGARPPASRPPNIVLILADDLGYAELGCYGQQTIRTPNIDRLAFEGMRFTQHYSGSPVCAPSRCTLLTGRHTGHAFIRANCELGGWERDAREGQLPLPPATDTLGTMLQDRGYATAAIGKWGLGGPETTGHPNLQGFDHWYGYLCQRVAHNYYPTHLWRNQDKDILAGNPYFKAHQKLDAAPEGPDAWTRFRGEQYAPDLMIDEAERFVRDHRDEPFLLYYATPVPHAAIQVPQDSLTPYLGSLDQRPYLGEKGYLPHPAPRAGYAAMVTRMDRDVGRLLDLLDELGLADDTIVLFTSDNGPTFNGGTDSAFFRSGGPLRGLKASLWEGGIRVPLLVRWPGRIAAGSVSDHVCAFWDVLPTVTDLLDADDPQGADGRSFAPTLLGDAATQREHDLLYWEYRGGQAVRLGRWKGLRRRGGTDLELYDLQHDPGETRDVAADHPELVDRIAQLMATSRTESEHFPLE